MCKLEHVKKCVNVKKGKKTVRECKTETVKVCHPKPSPKPHKTPHRQPTALRHLAPTSNPVGVQTFITIVRPL